MDVFKQDRMKLFPTSHRETHVTTAIKKRAVYKNAEKSMSSFNLEAA